MSTSLRILFFSTNYFPREVGGAEKSLRILAHDLAARGHAVAVVTPAEGGGTAREEDGPIAVFRVPLSALAFRASAPGGTWRRKLVRHLAEQLIPAGLGAIRQIVRDFAPDVLHVSSPASFSPLLFLALQRGGLPLVITVRDYYFHNLRGIYTRGEKERLRRRLSRYGGLLRRVLLRSADLVLFNSQNLANNHQQILNPRKPSCVLYTDPPKIEMPAWQGPANPPGHTLLILARLDTGKGIREFVECFAACTAEDFRLEIGGDGPLQEEIARACAPHSRVRLLGRLDERAKWAAIQAATVIVVPSTWEEPLPRAIWEGLAARKLVLGSDRGGIPEMLDQGRRGLVFSWDDPASLPGCFAQLRVADATLEAKRLAGHAFYLASRQEPAAAKLEHLYRRHLGSHFAA